MITVLSKTENRKAIEYKASIDNGSNNILHIEDLRIDSTPIAEQRAKAELIKRGLEQKTVNISIAYNETIKLNSVIDLKIDYHDGLYRVKRIQTRSFFDSNGFYLVSDITLESFI
jgi:hypothetical protein